MFAVDFDGVVHAQLEAAVTALMAGIAATSRAGVGKGYFLADDAVDAADLSEEVVRV